MIDSGVVLIWAAGVYMILRKGEIEIDWDKPRLKFTGNVLDSIIGVGLVVAGFCLAGVFP